MSCGVVGLKPFAAQAGLAIIKANAPIVSFGYQNGIRAALRRKNEAMPIWADHARNRGQSAHDKFRCIATARRHKVFCEWGARDQTWPTRRGTF